MANLLQSSPVGSAEQYKRPGFYFSPGGTLTFIGVIILLVFIPSLNLVYRHRHGLSMEETDCGRHDQERRKCFPWPSATLWCLHFFYCLNYVGLQVPYQSGLPSRRHRLGKQSFSADKIDKQRMQKQRQREVTHLWAISYQHRKASGSHEGPVTQPRCDIACRLSQDLRPMGDKQP